MTGNTIGAAIALLPIAIWMAVIFPKALWFLAALVAWVGWCQFSFWIGDRIDELNPGKRQRGSK